LSSYGSYLSAFSGLFFFYILYVTIVRGERVTSDPWNLRQTNYLISSSK
jgi:heme/copper-type cytochrome/quinol oxidase subunit 1